MRCAPPSERPGGGSWRLRERAGGTHHARTLGAPVNGRGGARARRRGSARPDWIDGLVDLKIATTFGGGRLNAELTLSVLRDGSYRKHLEALRQRLARAMVDVGGRLRDIGLVPWLEPQAGMFLWCKLPDGIDASDIAKAALAHNVVLAPGNAFSVSQSAGNYLRFNVSQSMDDRVFQVLRAAIREAAER